MDSQKMKIAVVGAGTGGYAAAFRASDFGHEVFLFDQNPNPGGVCLYRGCIPSKAMLHAAGVIEETRSAAAIGLKYKPAEKMEGFGCRQADRRTRYSGKTAKSHIHSGHSRIRQFEYPVRGQG